MTIRRPTRRAMIVLAMARMPTTNARSVISALTAHAPALTAGRPLAPTASTHYTRKSQPRATNALGLASNPKDYLMATVYHTPQPTRPLGAYEFIATPPIQLILNAIRAHCGVGGTIRPGVRRLAAWANYASAGRISPMLDQLAADGWILFDPTTGLITLLEDPSPAITERDQWAGDDTESPAITERDHWKDSAAITPRDRDLAQQDAESLAITERDRSTPRMEDHVLVAATENQESAAAKYNNIPCSSPESITRRDRPAALLLAELGTNRKLIAQAFIARPDLTPEQVRATWAYFEPRVAAGRCEAGAFHAAIASGQIHAAPPDPASDWHGLAPPDDDPDPPGESLHERARRICPDGVSGHDFRFLVLQLGEPGITDSEALAALAERQQPRRRR
jgi:hypothetical protein